MERMAHRASRPTASAHSAWLVALSAKARSVANPRSGVHSDPCGHVPLLALRLDLVLLAAHHADRDLVTSHRLPLVDEPEGARFDTPSSHTRILSLRVPCGNR